MQECTGNVIESFVRVRGRSLPLIRFSFHGVESRSPIPTREQMFSSSFPQNKAANGCADIHLIKETGWKSQIAASLLLALRNNTHSSVSVFQTPHQPLTA